MELKELMIVATFVLGVVVVIIGMLALWKNRAKTGKGNLKMLGIEVSGSGGAVIILLVGAAFVLSGFGWAASQKDAVEQQTVVKQRTAELKTAADAINSYEEEKTQVRNHLIAVLPPDKLKELEIKVPAFKSGLKWKPSAELMRSLHEGPVR